MMVTVVNVNDKPLFLSSLVTIVVVTSPIESHPSTELLDRCVSSIVRAWPALADCPIVVAADGCALIHDDAINSKRKRVFGKANAETVARYHAFLNQVAKRSAWMTLDRPTPILRKECICEDTNNNNMSTEWLGFALTLQKAIEAHVKTPLVFVTPHDYELIPEALEHVLIERLVRAILPRDDDDDDDATTTTNRIHINYIGLPNAKSLTFRKRHAQALDGLQSVLLLSSDDDDEGQLELEPLGLWKENPHLASVQAYRDFVFGGTKTNQKDCKNSTSTRSTGGQHHRLALSSSIWQHHTFKRGHFIEDTLGQQMLTALKTTASLANKRELFEQRFRTYLLNQGQPCTYHIDGLKYIDTHQRSYAPAKPFEIQAARAATQFVHAKTTKAGTDNE